MAVIYTPVLRPKYTQCLIMCTPLNEDVSYGEN